MLGNRGFPEAWSRLCVCQASFLMTFAMGGVPHAGPRHTYILLYNYKTDFYSEKECFMIMKSQTMKFSIIGRIAFQFIFCLLWRQSSNPPVSFHCHHCPKVRTCTLERRGNSNPIPLKQNVYRSPLQHRNWLKDGERYSKSKTLWWNLDWTN